ncbi:hypothetical protein A3860_39785 [Niastella vici]|uniref:Uncharacterized protein n=1 Tax=Niastella vici TaxID=1703345 RepID=A0A1V9FHR7_9BACT|nr:hypothetical protein A3860_39785 [Niastella vici]
MLLKCLLGFLSYRTILTSDKKRRYREVSRPREIAGKKKGGGSLSIPIVLIERWEISSMKAT